MAGIYIHIPFCRRACHYCNFHFSTSQQQLTAMVQAIIKEAALRKDYLSEPVHTVYFGGGTPSLLSNQEITDILSALKRSFSIEPGSEITLEANPDDINSEKLEGWKASGITRLSIGIQSFIEVDLRWMNRVHNVQQAIESIGLAQQYGFNNITIDLIYGTPTLSDEQWHQNVMKALSLQVPHLSCYALTVEPKTALDKMIATNTKENIDPEKQARHFELLMKWMDDAGYEHYEISNFSKPGFRSRHNSSYWKGSPYLGLGPSAHSFNGNSRQWNIANNALYTESLEKNIIPFEIETLTSSQQLNEYIMTALRTKEGISLNTVRESWGNKKAEAIITSANAYPQRGHMLMTSELIQLTTPGKLMADGIAAFLFQ